MFFLKLRFEWNIKTFFRKRFPWNTMDDFSFMKASLYSALTHTHTASLQLWRKHQNSLIRHFGSPLEAFMLYFWTKIFPYKLSSSFFISLFIYYIVRKHVPRVPSKQFSTKRKPWKWPGLLPGLNFALSTALKHFR